MNKGGGFKLSDSDKRLIIILASIVLVVVVYFFVFTKGMSRASEIEEQNEVDRQRLQEYQDMVARSGQVQQETDEMNAEREEIISHYPASVKSEDVIKWILDMEEETDMETSSASFSTGNVMSATSAAVTEAATTDDAEEGDDAAASTASQTTMVYGMYTTTNISYTGGYEDLKSLLDYVLGLNDRTTITSVSAAYDSATGQLAGSFTVNMYYMLGTDAEYEEPKFGIIDTGVDNIFGATIENSEVVEAEEGEGSEEAEEAE